MIINNRKYNKNNINNSYDDYKNKNQNHQFVESGFERPIEQLKNKIMLLEKQIKFSPEQ